MIVAGDKVVYTCNCDFVFYQEGYECVYFLNKSIDEKGSVFSIAEYSVSDLNDFVIVKELGSVA
jgi:hypothetical protein